MGLSERSGSTVTSSEATAGRVVALAKVTATLGEFDHTLKGNEHHFWESVAFFVPPNARL